MLWRCVEYIQQTTSISFCLKQGGTKVWRSAEPHCALKAKEEASDFHLEGLLMDFPTKLDKQVDLPPEYISFKQSNAINEKRCNAGHFLQCRTSSENYMRRMGWTWIFSSPRMSLQMRWLVICGCNSARNSLILILRIIWHLVYYRRRMQQQGSNRSETTALNHPAFFRGHGCTGSAERMTMWRDKSSERGMRVLFSL